MKLYLVSLGCFRNLVDSEVMLGQLGKAGWAITQEPSEAHVIIINTCGFIASAIDESIDVILELAALKKNGNCKRLIVVGCLPERFGEEIVDALPEVDVFLGTGAFDRIVKAAEGALGERSCIFPDPNLISFPGQADQRVQTFPHMSFLRIAEGCSRHCTYCIIPKLRGKHRSRHLEDIMAEARYLILSGVKELILVAQDTTFYGRDLDPAVNCGQLLSDLAGISDKVWIRVLYGHPGSIDNYFIKSIAEHENICSYFDLPIQHASNRILKRMGRNYSRDDLSRLFDKIRSLVPDAALRTTVITGFPGETDEDFEILLDFVEAIDFDHLGVFTYSDSEDLVSHKLSDHVPENVAKDRYDHLMSRQAEISLEHNKKHKGRTYKVLVEEKAEDNLYVGRTFFQAPEVDGITYIESGQLEIGSFTVVKIKAALEYDLIGEVV